MARRLPRRLGASRRTRTDSTSTSVGCVAYAGCPQRRAQEGHYGGYLLGQRDWPVVESISTSSCSPASALVHSTPLPVSVKLRLCDYAADTPALAVRLARAGAAVVTLHARHVAPNRRRANAAKLTYVYDVRTALLDAGLHASQPGGHCHVLSNGNVRGWADVVANLGATHADGVMVGEPLLEQPHLFAPSVQKKATALDALDTYLGLCEAYPHDSLPMQRVHQHVQYMIKGGFAPSRETRQLHDTLRSAPDVATMRRDVVHYATRPCAAAPPP